MRFAFCLLIGMALVFGPAGRAAAQATVQLTDQVEANPEPMQAELDLRAVIARELARIGHMDLRLQDSPTPEDLAMLDSVLAIVQDLDRDNQELIRRRIELAYRLGDPLRLEARTRELVRLDPKDTVAQLRLISARISQIQTVEGRMEAYSRYLGAGGERLDPAIRSRLALDAALLAREQGDERAFVGLLTRSVQLDSTNKDAASLAATFFATRIPNDPVGQFELSLNLLLADPVDPNMHLMIARQLARVGAFAQAARFHALASTIEVAEGGRISDVLNAERMILAWQMQGPELPMRQLTDGLANQRYTAAVNIRMAEVKGLATLGMSRPEDIHLGDALERIRVLSAHAAGDQELLDQSLGELRISLDQLNRMRLSPGDLPAGMTIEQVNQQTLELTAVLFLLHAWTGQNMDAIIQRLKDDPAIFGQNAPPMMRAFAAIYVEGPEDAEARFGELVDKNPRAWIGMGLSLERQGRMDEAVRAYAWAARAMPLQPEGAWARSRAAQISGLDVLLTEHSVALSRLAAGVPVWIDRMIADPSSAMQLELEFVKRSFTPLEPITLEITLRNAGPEPLGLGGDRPIQSRLLVSPNIDVGIQQRILTALPEVLDLDRRLRLNPREEVVATIDVLGAFTGWFLDSSIESTGRVRARVIQGFRRGGDGRLTTGALAVASQTETVLRTTIIESAMSADELAIRIERASEGQLVGALLAARMLLIGVKGELEPAAAQRIVGACVDRFALMSGDARASAILLLPTPRLVPALKPFEDAVRLYAAGESDRLVLAATLLVCVTTPDDPILDLEAVAADSNLATIAHGVRARLARDAGGYSGAGPGVADLMPRAARQQGN